MAGGSKRLIVLALIANSLIAFGLGPEAWPGLGAEALIEPYETTCGPDVFPIEEATRLQNLYVVSFFKAHLLDDGIEVSAPVGAAHGRLVGQGIFPFLALYDDLGIGEGRDRLALGTAAGQAAGMVEVQVRHDHDVDVARCHADLGQGIVQRDRELEASRGNLGSAVGTPRLGPQEQTAQTVAYFVSTAPMLHGGCRIVG